MSRSADCRSKTLKWMREPSNGTRIVVIVSAMDSDHIDLMHHGFSCFDNIALVQVEPSDMGAHKCVEVHVAGCDYSFLVCGELEESLLSHLSIGNPCIYQIGQGSWAVRSVIEAVEQVKKLARLSYSRLETSPDICRISP
ncbi:hypothetical protein [Pseudomonas thivervalensis]|uniref:hypothetical protein n=1 Tax=Pseudomonas thivervalensis TaxID=86265 RepID=UPI00069D3E79|nr:hypothetical protein [Pseudomonas thivervalensis]OAB49446.1 hypothetical protein APS14_12915 [Pseudomonas thivervalensis]SDF72992.1 hypothetical protein SAMN04490204_1641 [Pseudomonas thivervalensis]